MGSKRTLNVRNLQALGTGRLTKLLIEFSQDRILARRLLRLELAATEGPAGLAREIRNRLTTIARSCAALDLQKRRDPGDEFELHRKAIVDRVASDDAPDALDLM